MARRTKIGMRREANADTSSAFYQERRKEIVDAAAITFQERGYDAATLSHIAEKLNADRASLYYYFGSKQELFREVVRDVALNSVTTAEEIAARDEPADAKLRAAFRAVMFNYATSYPYMHVFLQENFSTISASGDPWMAETLDWSRRYYEAIRAILAQGVAEGTFRLPLPIGVTSMGVVGAVNWAHRWYKPGGTLPPEAIGEGFADMILNGLRSEPTITA